MTDAGVNNLRFAIVSQAVDDYFSLLSMLASPTVNRNIFMLEDFFHSGWFALLCDLDGDVLMEKIQKKAKNMKVKYLVSRLPDGTRYYVHKAQEPNIPIPDSYGRREHCLQLAAKMNGLDVKSYMRMLRRDGIKV